MKSTIKTFKNVPVEVKQAITKYCKDKRITQANYLILDKRLKNYYEN